MGITGVCLGFITVFYSLNSVKTQELKFKVIAPEFVCMKDNSSQTLIRLLGDDVPNLKYNWSIGFTLENVHGLKQRNVMILWQNLRKLDNTFNDLSTDDLNQGLIYINNSFLSPGIKYIFNISAQKNDSSIIDTRQFVLELLTNTKSVMSAEVLGPEITYSDILYTARAEMMSCAINPEYSLSWQLLDQTNHIIHEITTKSRILQLAPGMLHAGNSYLIKYLVSNKTSQQLRVQVLERGLKLVFNTKYLKIGANQPIYINAFFIDPDCVHGELTFDWKCEPEKHCATFESANTTELVLKKGISIIGSYKITLIATKGNVNTSTSTQLEITEDLLPIIDVENALTACNPLDSLKISAHVNRLIIGCQLQWTSINNLSGYSHIDNFENLLGSPGKSIQIQQKPSAIEELTEEDQYVDKQFDLIIPTNDGSWKGLEGGAKYIFRLTASCPCSDVDSSSEAVLSAFADVEVIANELPALKMLEVNPKDGEALKTLFTFNIAQPSNGHQPITYKFGYLIEDVRVFITNQYDQPHTLSLLPFIGAPLRSLVQVCNCKSACNFALGPILNIKLPKFYTEIESNGLINNFKQSMLEQDYFNAFTLAQMMLKTSSKMPQNTTFKLFYDAIANTTTKQLQSLIKTTDNSWKEASIALLRHIKILDDQIHLPEAILNNILSLRDKIDSGKNILKKSEKLMTPISRKLLSLQQTAQKRIVNNLNLDEIKDYLEISELAVKRLSDFVRVEQEKQKLRDTLDNYLPRVCQFLYNNYKSEVRIELSTLVFVVEKINIVRKYDELIFIPYETPVGATLLLGKEIADKYRNQIGLCIGKMIFIDDYFNITQYVYNIQLYTALLNEYLNAETENTSILLEMPIKTLVLDNQTLQCVLWIDNKWDSSKCQTTQGNSKKIKCSCKNLGYISLVPIDRITTTTISNNLFITTPAQESVQTSTISHAVTKNIYADQIGDYKTIDSGETNMMSAAVWSITLLSIGILTIFCAFLILLKRLSKNKAVQSFQSVQYAQYSDEFNMD